MSSADNGRRQNWEPGKWTPVRCAHWRSLPPEQRPEFEQWVAEERSRPPETWDVLKLPPGVVPTVYEVKTLSDDEMRAKLVATRFSRFYLMMLCAGWNVDQLGQTYQVDLSFLAPRKGEDTTRWRLRMQNYLETFYAHAPASD